MYTVCSINIFINKGTIMKPLLRHEEIVNLVKQYGYLSTEDLVEKFKLSPRTIRRDLSELANENKIRRHHGGATIPLSSVNTSYITSKAM